MHAVPALVHQAEAPSHPVSGGSGQAAGSPRGDDPVAGAYYEFMRGRQLEDTGRRRRRDRRVSARDEAGPDVGGHPGGDRGVVRATEPRAGGHRRVAGGAGDQPGTRRGQPRAGVHLRESCRTRPWRRGARGRAGELPPAGAGSPREVAGLVEPRHGGRRAPDDREDADAGVGVRPGHSRAQAAARGRAMAAAGRGHAGPGLHRVRQDGERHRPARGGGGDGAVVLRSARLGLREGRTAGPKPRAPTNRPSEQSPRDIGAEDPMGVRAPEHAR